MKKRFICEVYGYVNDKLTLLNVSYFNTFEEAYSFESEYCNCHVIKEVKKNETRKIKSIC